MDNRRNKFGLNITRDYLAAGVFPDEKKNYNVRTKFDIIWWYSTMKLFVVLVFCCKIPLLIFSCYGEFCILLSQKKY